MKQHVGVVCLSRERREPAVGSECMSAVADVEASVAARAEEFAEIAKVKNIPPGNFQGCR